MEIFYFDNNSPGWAPITHLVNLCGKLFSANLNIIPSVGVSRYNLAKKWFSLPKHGVGEHALFFAKSPAELKLFLSMPEFDRPFRSRTVWIIDSFWTEWCPSQTLLNHFDLVAYTQKYEAGFYETRSNGRSIFLGWGSDVLDLGSSNKMRDIDLLRVGRQPQIWDDDIRSANICAQNNIRFNGRPPYGENPMDQYKNLMSTYARSKLILAHSNLADPHKYTHPTKEYITARWTDSLASGATVAGVPPLLDTSITDLFWPNSLVEFKRLDFASNIAQIKEVVNNWTPEVALYNYTQALKKLDWRWRLQLLADRIGISSPVLNADIERLKTKIAISKS